MNPFVTLIFGQIMVAEVTLFHLEKKSKEYSIVLSWHERSYGMEWCSR